VGNKFVKKKKSDFAQTVNVNAHNIKYTARPWLGTSTSDNNEIVAITQRYLANIKTPRITR
jgi:UDP-glucose 6-dehydrogenase